MRQQMVGLAMALAVLPGTAGAEGIQGRWSLALSGGTDVELSGDMHTAGSGRVLTLPTRVEAREYSDIYDGSFRGQLSVGYGVTRNVEIFGRGSYYKMTSGNVLVGDVARLDLYGSWTDYKEWGFEAGPRLYFAPDKTLEARHFCMMMRGVEKQGSTTTTSEFMGAYAESATLRQEFLAALQAPPART